MFSKGPSKFFRHQYYNTDKLFMISSGVLRNRYCDQKGAVLEARKSLLVSAGSEHCLVGDPEAHIVLFEPEDTVNTGNVEKD